MPIDFPTSPTLGNTITSGNVVWTWNGASWEAASISLYGGFNKLDDISSQFNGSTTSFAIRRGGVAITPYAATNLVISINGVIQEPNIAYTVSGSTITFFEEAPQAGSTFFGVMLGDIGSVATTVYNPLYSLDDISSNFNGSRTQFTISSNSANLTPVAPQHILVSVNGVLQQPVDAYSISGSTITFTEAPLAGSTFFGTMLGNVGTVATVTDGSVTSAKMTATGVTAATYGNATITPVITVDSAGRITSASNTTISAGITTGKSIAMAIVFGG